MIIGVIIILTSCAFVCLAASWCQYIDELYERELAELQRDADAIKAEAIRRECRRVRRFLEADGETVNQAAVAAYLRKRERQNRRAAEVVAFEVIE